jgi:hypothetical protein
MKPQTPFCQISLCQVAIRPERVVVGPLVNDSEIERVRCEAPGPKPPESDSRLISIEAVGRSTSWDREAVIQQDGAPLSNPGIENGLIENRAVVTECISPTTRFILNSPFDLCCWIHSCPVEASDFWTGDCWCSYRLPFCKWMKFQRPNVRPGGTRPFMPFVNCLPSRRRPVFDEILSRYPEAKHLSTNIQVFSRGPSPECWSSCGCCLWGSHV